MDGLRLATAPQGHRPLQTGPSCVIDSSPGWPASPANAAPIGHLSGPCTTRVAPRLARCPPSANADTIIVMDAGRGVIPDVLAVRQNFKERDAVDVVLARRELQPGIGVVHAASFSPGSTF